MEYATISTTLEILDSSDCSDLRADLDIISKLLGKDRKQPTERALVRCSSNYDFIQIS